MKKCKAIKLRVRIKEEDGQYSAICEELGTASCGDTIEEAEKNIMEAIRVDLDSMEQHGVMMKFLKEKGIKIETIEHEGKPRKKEIIPTSQNLEIAYCL